MSVQQKSELKQIIYRLYYGNDSKIPGHNIYSMRSIAGALGLKLAFVASTLARENT